MFNFIGGILSKIKESNFYKIVANFIHDVKNAITNNDNVNSAKEFVDGQMNENKSSNNSSAYSYTMNRILHFFNSTKFKKIKNCPFVKFMGKLISIGFGIGFGALIAYIMYKILPTVLVIIATLIGVSIIVEVVMSLLGNLFNIDKKVADEQAV